MVRFSYSYGAISCFNGEDNLYSSGMASFIVAWPDCFVYDDRVNDINWARNYILRRLICGLQEVKSIYCICLHTYKVPRINHETV